MSPPVEAKRELVGDGGIQFRRGDEQLPAADLNIRRRELHLHGTPYDISRVMDACRKALDRAAADGDNESLMSVNIPAPQDDEP